MGSIGIPMPLVSTTLAVLRAFVGGIALATGLGSRPILSPRFFTDPRRFVRRRAPRRVIGRTGHRRTAAG